MGGTITKRTHRSGTGDGVAAGALGTECTARADGTHGGQRHDGL